MAGPEGHIPPEQIQAIATLSAQMQQVLRELKVQFERIAQMQAQLDSIAKGR